MATENKNEILFEGVNDYMLNVNEIFLWRYKEKSLNKYKGGNVVYFQRDNKANNYYHIVKLEKEYRSIEKELEIKGYQKTNDEVICPKISKSMKIIYLILCMCLVVTTILSILGMTIFLLYIPVILLIILTLYILSVISKKHCDKIILRQDEILNLAQKMHEAELL